MGHHMDNLLRSFIRDESGAAAAEYALILAIIGAGVAVATTDLGIAISSAFTTAQGYF
jgi:pilus assembly protein Flp/PilA